MSTKHEGFTPRCKSAKTPIIERLRAGGATREMGNVNRCALMLDAADEMARLYAENQRLREALGLVARQDVRRNVPGVRRSSFETRIMEAYHECRTIARAALEADA